MSGETQIGVFWGLRFGQNDRFPHPGKERLRIGALQLTSAQSQQSLAVVFRDHDPNKNKNLPKPQMILYGTLPVVSTRSAGALHIRRIDRSESRWIS